MNFVPAHRLGLSALELFQSLDGETDPGLSDLFRVFDGLGKLCGDQRPIFGIELAGFGGVLVEPEVGPVCGKLGLTRQQADERVAMAISAFV